MNCNFTTIPEKSKSKFIHTNKLNVNMYLPTTYLIDFNMFYFLVAGDANTLSPMENNQNVIKNNENNTKADLMTMSTPPHLLSAALENSEDGQPLLPKRYYNHRSKFFKYLYIYLFLIINVKYS